MAANYANIDKRALNILTLSYLLSRLAYNVVYVYLGENRNLASLRSGTWGLAVGFAGALWYYAGVAVMNRK